MSSAELATERHPRLAGFHRCAGCRRWIEERLRFCSDCDPDVERVRDKRSIFYGFYRRRKVTPLHPSNARTTEPPP